LSPFYSSFLSPDTRIEDSLPQIWGYHPGKIFPPIKVRSLLAAHHALDAPSGTGRCYRLVFRPHSLASNPTAWYTTLQIRHFV
jgi:hypothetical protein